MKYKSKDNREKKEDKLIVYHVAPKRVFDRRCVLLYSGHTSVVCYASNFIFNEHIFVDGRPWESMGHKTIDQWQRCYECPTT